MLTFFKKEFIRLEDGCKKAAKFHEVLLSIYRPEFIGKNIDQAIS